MNCKQGDLAMIVRSVCDNAGRIVVCKAFVPTHSYTHPNGSVISGPSWVVEPPVYGWRGDKLPCVQDASLRPIRGGGGEDEMLQIAGLPKPILEKA